MSEPYVGEIRMFAGNFAPNGWAFCDGQLLAVSQNDALFSLIGTTYGGDGQTTFGLPDLRGRIPVHQGNGNVLGGKGGTETVTLTVSQISAHTHPLQASSDLATESGASGNVLSRPTSVDPFILDVADVDLSPETITPVGGSQAHSNLMPSLCINFIIALFGIYPSST